jgi:hypothetical protein
MVMLLSKNELFLPKYPTPKAHKSLRVTAQDKPPSCLRQGRERSAEGA